MRLDVFLVQHKKIESRTKAQDLIAQGQVILRQGNHEKVLTKPGLEVSENLYAHIEIKSTEILKYVSRAGLKLEAALDKINKNVDGLSAWDIGQSTGGFTDCLIQRGAKLVIGVDVGENQLHPKIKTYDNVRTFEKMNIKNITTATDFVKTVPAQGFDLVVCDVSFISVTHVISVSKQYLSGSGEYLFLIKPQFECGIEHLDKNGIVKDVAVYKNIEKNMREQFQNKIGTVLDYFPSQLTGKDGNQEFFIYGQNSN